MAGNPSVLPELLVRFCNESWRVRSIALRNPSLPVALHHELANDELADHWVAHLAANRSLEYANSPVTFGTASARLHVVVA